MSRTLPIKKLTLPAGALQAMPEQQRSALLMLGLFLNEANWLRKLLLKAALAISDTPEGQANFALTALLATTLAGKIHEGWDRITEGHLHDALKGVDQPDELKLLQAKLSAAISGKTFVRIRNNIAFHYPERPLAFKKLPQLDDADTVIYMAPQGYGGDILSHLSTLAGIEPLLAINADPDYGKALESIWNEVTHVTGLYCQFVSETMASLMLEFIPGVVIEEITIPDAPDAYADSLRFFVHPPHNLEEMRAEVALRDKQ